MRKGKRKTRIIGEIGIISILLAVVFIAVGNFWEFGDVRNENVSHAEYSGVKIGATDFGGDYGLKAVSGSAVNPNGTSQKLMTVSASFYNYRYDNEMKKGWRDQGIDGELSGVAHPFSRFNGKLNEHYRDMSSDWKFGVYVGNFYNHWRGSYNSKNYNWCINNYAGFAWAQNIANRGTYSAVCQGLVGESLKGFKWDSDTYNPGTLMCKDATKAFPLFNEEFLEQKYTSTDEVGIGVVANQVGFPFRYEHDDQKGTHYVFDSKYDSVTFEGSSTDGCSDTASTYKYYYGKASKSTTDSPDDKPTLKYHYQTNAVSTRSNRSAQFLPFNKKGDAAKDIDFGFGMRLDIPFYLTANGMQAEADGGKPMKFNFEGDDDVWVFIDGELVLDLGGAHAKTVGSIDFSGTNDTMSVYAKKVAYTGGESDKTTNTTAGTNQFENGSDNTHVRARTEKKTIAKDEVHVLTIFYMERGMIESNLYMDFNFIPHSEELEQPTGDSVQTDSELTVKTEIDFDQVASPFETKVKELAEDDAFQYKIENAGTGKGNVQDSGIQYPSQLLSVRKHESKISYWSFGEQPNVKVYFDASKVQGKKANNNSYSWGSTQEPGILGDSPFSWGELQPMSVYENKIYWYEIPIGKNIQFANQVENGYKTGTIKITGAHDGMLYQVTKFEDSMELKGSFVKSDYPGNSVYNHSMNLPYQTLGSSSNFLPTNSSGYNSVASTTYQLTEAYLAETETYDESTMSGTSDVHIFQNNSPTSAKTSSSGIFSLLSKDSATFLKQFRMDSIMKVTQQELLGVMVRPEIVAGDTDGDKYVSYANGGTRKSKDFYYTTVSAKNIISNDERNVEVNKAGEFKFANVKAAETDEDFTSSEKITINETFTNQVKTGNICISKKTTGMKNSADNEYKFKVTFKDIFGVAETDSEYTGYAVPYVHYASDGTKTEGILDVSTPVVTLKADEKVIITGIPAGTKYRIEETNPSDVVVGDIAVSYETKVDGATKMVTDVEMDGAFETVDNIESFKTGTTGTIVGNVPTSIKNSATSETVNEFDEVDVNITFTNQKGVIRIEKLAIGEWKNFKDAEYTFTITDTSSNTVITDWKYDIYEYDKTTGDEKVVATEQAIGSNGEIKIKATQWALIQDIPLTATTATYKITETGLGDEGTYFKVNSIDVNKGTCTTEADLTAGTITMELSNEKPRIDVTYVNRYDPSYVEIFKYVDKLYYQDKDGKETNYSDDITYQSLTDAKQSFIFTIEEYATQEKAEGGNEADLEGTFNITIPIAETSSLLSSNVSFEDSDYKYKYGSSQTIKLTLGKWYRISEDTSWSWKYNLQGLDSDVGKDTTKNNGTVTIYTDRKYAIFQGGDEDSMPVIKFYNTLTTDEDKLAIEGDTDVVPNIIKVE